MKELQKINAWGWSNDDKRIEAINDLVDAVQELQSNQIEDSANISVLWSEVMEKELEELGEKGLINATTVERGKVPEKHYTITELREKYRLHAGHEILFSGLESERKAVESYLDWLEQEDNARV